LMFMDMKLRTVRRLARGLLAVVVRRDPPCDELCWSKAIEQREYKYALRLGVRL
jgi:hypothetical protein